MAVFIISYTLFSRMFAFFYNYIFIIRENAYSIFVIWHRSFWFPNLLGSTYGIPSRLHLLNAKHCHSIVVAVFFVCDIMIISACIVHILYTPILFYASKNTSKSKLFIFESWREKCAQLERVTTNPINYIEQKRKEQQQTKKHFFFSRRRI